MRYLLFGMFLLCAGCAPDVVLVHPETNDRIICEGKYGAVSNHLAQERCIADFKKKGYEEQHSALKRSSSADAAHP